MDIVDNQVSGVQRGVIVEFDFTAIDGAEILFTAAKETLAPEGVELTAKLEALHLAGGNCQGGIAELFRKLDIPADAAAIARTLSENFREKITARLAGSVTPEIRAMLEKLVSRGLKVVLSTRGNPEALRQELEGFDPAQVAVYGEASNTYGNCKWDAWRRALAANGLHDVITVGVAGSGYGVKAALIAGMPAAAVVNPHVAYQDFGGADAIAEKLDGDFAEELLKILRMA